MPGICHRLIGNPITSLKPFIKSSSLSALFSDQILNGEPLKEVDCFKYLGSQVAANGGCERDVAHRMNEGYRAWEALKSVLSNRGLRINAKKCLYEGVIVPTALYGAEAWGMRSAERRKVNVLEIKCLRSLV